MRWENQTPLHRGVESADRDCTSRSSTAGDRIMASRERERERERERARAREDREHHPLSACALTCARELLEHGWSAHSFDVLFF